jgi:hypothetical protein
MAEEPVAELTAASLCAELGFEGKLREASLGADQLRSSRPHGSVQLHEGGRVGLPRTNRTTRLRRACGRGESP